MQCFLVFFKSKKYFFAIKGFIKLTPSFVCLPLAPYTSPLPTFKTKKKQNPVMFISSSPIAPLSSSFPCDKLLVYCTFVTLLFFFNLLQYTHPPSHPHSPTHISYIHKNGDKQDGRYCPSWVHDDHDSLQLLLQHGADPTIRDNCGNSVWSIVRSRQGTHWCSRWGDVHRSHRMSVTNDKNRRTDTHTHTHALTHTPTCAQTPTPTHAYIHTHAYLILLASLVF